LLDDMVGIFITGDSRQVDTWLDLVKRFHSRSRRAWRRERALRKGGRRKEQRGRKDDEQQC
jgi:hypothetical protein